MIYSSTRTVAVPVITLMPGAQPPSPVTIVKDVTQDCVVRIRNNSFGQFVLISFDDSALQSVPARAETYKLPAGQLDVFVVAKGQSLYAATNSGPIDGAGAEISIHVYQRLPVEVL